MSEVRRTGRLAMWLGLLTSIAFAARTVAGCAPKCRVDSFVEPSTGRPYRVLSRPDHQRGRPAKVLFSLHSYATDPDVVVEGYALSRHAVHDHDLLLVVPEGRRDADGHLHWNASQACCGSGPRHDDLSYLRSVLHDLHRHFSVDKRQVFAFGVSNGAFMAQRWACAGQGELAAIVSIAGAGQGPDDPPCISTSPVSVVHLHGTADDVILYAGRDDASGRYPSARAGMQRWVAINGGSGKSTLTRRRSLLLERVTIESWSTPRAELSLWSFEGGDHKLRSARFFMGELVEFLLRAPRAPR